jgi:small conductance mechanosensitive channel
MLEGDGDRSLDESVFDLEPVTDFGELLELVREAAAALVRDFVVRLPLILLALAVLVVGLILVAVVVRAVDRGFERSRAEHAAQRLVGNLLRATLVLLVLLLALSVAGVQVGAVLAALGLAGLALAFALQNILENFVAGILILIRKPFRRGDQIETHTFQGTVEDIDLRVTRIRDFDGELVLVPNAMVFAEPIVNLTRLRPRRTRLTIGVDYRDDHDQARAVLQEALEGVVGVLDNPPCEVLLYELADSSVDFELAYWTQPQIREVRHVRDRVLSTCKRALEDAGMTIPWPIRTLAGETSVQLRGGDEAGSGTTRSEEEA